MPGDVQTEVFASTNNININRVRKSGKSYYAEAVVTVLNSDLAPVEGAVVSGSFSGASAESLVTATGADGKVVFSSEVVTRPSGEWCFTVTDITAAGATYNETLNPQTTSCETASEGGKGRGKNRR